MRSRRCSFAVLLAIAFALAACGSSEPDVESGTTSTTEPTVVDTGTAETDFSDLSDVSASKVQPAEVDWGDFDLTDQRLFTVLSQVHETFRLSAGEIWSDDYRFDTTPMAFARRSGDGEVTRMYVLNNPSAASMPGAVKLELDSSLGLPDVYQVDVPDNIANKGEQELFDFDVTVGDTGSMFFFLPEGDPLLSPSTWDFARFIVHETFHRYQLIDARWNEDFPENSLYPRSADNAALTQLEDRVLDAMTEADTDDEIRRRLAQFVAIRQERGMIAEIGDLADIQELAEGTARFVENRYSEISGRPGNWGIEPEEQPTLDWLSFGRFYSTGASLVRALDQLDVDVTGPAAVGTPLTTLAAEAVKDIDSGSLLDEAKIEFDYESLLDASVAADLDNAASMMGGPANPVQCLADGGLPIDTSIDVNAALNDLLAEIDASDPEVSALLESCGLGSVRGAPGGTEQAEIDESEVVDCLIEAGFEVGPSGVDSVDFDDSNVQAALNSCFSG